MFRNLCVGLLAITLVGAGDSRCEVPRTLRHSNPSVRSAAWVPLNEAIDPSGDLRTDVFSEASASMLLRNMTANSGGACEVFLGAPTHEDFLPRSNARDVIENANTALSGTVVGVTHGFHNGHPGTLFTLRVSNRLKQQVLLAKGENLYLFIHEATVAVGERLICARVGATEGTQLPAKGDRLVAFSYGRPVDEWNAIVEVDPAHMILQRRGTRHVQPGQLAMELGVTTIDAALTRLNAHPAIRRLER